ncbi:hypothetical protein CUP0889 [Campylobacter upsaliensis RM3195]|nr:hypothetical protein CUP0652 [Campylobacter upsaliensis RM3195]EAL54126.1 hypothetical protein CUP0889 [Campylobacter upsaliensis RM3195]
MTIFNLFLCFIISKFALYFIFSLFYISVFYKFEINVSL